MNTPPDNLGDDPAGDHPGGPAPADAQRPDDFDLHDAAFEALRRELVANLPTEQPDSD